MTDSPHRLPDQLPAAVTDSPALRRVCRDLESLTTGQLQYLKVSYIGVVQRALDGVPVTPHAPGSAGER